MLAYTVVCSYMHTQPHTHTQHTHSFSISILNEYVLTRKSHLFENNTGNWIRLRTTLETVFPDFPVFPTGQPNWQHYVPLHSYMEYGNSISCFNYCLSSDTIFNLAYTSDKTSNITSVFLVLSLHNAVLDLFQCSQSRVHWSSPMAAPHFILHHCTM